MKTKKELIIALIVAIVMIGFCCFMIFGRKVTKQDTSDLKIYELHVKDGVDEDDDSLSVEEKYYYSECYMPEEDKLTLLKNFKKIIKFNIDQTKSGAYVKGSYKVTYGDDYIAFDTNDNLVYSSETNRVHEYNSDIYDLVIKACE